MERLFTCFQERSLVCWHQNPQRIMHLRHLYFHLFITTDVKGLKFLFKCYMSEITTTSNGRFLKYQLNAPLSPISLPLSPYPTDSRKLHALSLTLFLGWEPNFKSFPGLTHIFIVIQINDTFMRLLEKLSLYSSEVFKGWILLYSLSSNTSLCFPLTWFSCRSIPDIDLTAHWCCVSHFH